MSDKRNIGKGELSPESRSRLYAYYDREPVKDGPWGIRGKQRTVVINQDGVFRRVFEDGRTAGRPNTTEVENSVEISAIASQVEVIEEPETETGPEEEPAEDQTTLRETA